MSSPISPGIYTNVLTFNDYAQQLVTTLPAMVGGATKGPVNTPTTVSSAPDLFRKFGPVIASDYGLLAAVEYLKSGSQLLYTRVANGDVKSDVTVQGPVGAVAGVAALGTISFPGSTQPDNGDTVTIPDAALHATGSVTFTGIVAAADEVVLDDGTNPAVTFRFAATAGDVTQTPTLREVVIGASTAVLAANLAEAVNNAPTLAITAEAVGSVTNLTNDASGTAGNVAITETDTNGAMTLAGMSGGAASSNVIVYEFDAAVAATGNASFSGQPNDADTVVIDDGVNPAVTFEFDSDASVVESATLRQVVIGGTTADTVTNLINAINSTPTLDVTAAPGAGDSADLTNDTPGTAGNVALSGTDIATVQTLTGMSGGADASTVGGGNIAVSIGASAAATALNLANAINAQATLENSAVTADVDDESTIPLVRVFQTAANGADGNNTITQSGGGVAVTGFTGGTSASSGTPGTSVRFEALTSGSWGNAVRVEVVAPSTIIGAPATNYDLIVSAPVDDSGVVQVVERFYNLSNTVGDDRFVEDVLTDGLLGEVAPSTYIAAEVLATHAPYDASFQLGTTSQYVVAFTVGLDGITGLTADDYIGTVSGAQATGLKALRDPEQTEFNLLVVPGVSYSTVIDEMFSVSDLRGDCAAVIDPPLGLLRDEVIDWHNGDAFAVPNSPSAVLDDENGVLTWPWIQRYSEFLEQNIYLPPSVGLLDACANVDSQIGPWRAPAGFVFGAVDAVRLEFNPRREDRDLLVGGNNRVNPFAVFASVEGAVFYGNRTLLRASGPLDSIHVLRMVLFVKKAVTTSIQYLQFAPNDPTTWRDFQQTVEPILRSVLARRGLKSFTVKCDAETNPPELQSQKTMRAIVFLEHVDAAESIQIDFALKTTGANVDVTFAA